MKTLDEVIDRLIDCHTNWARWSQTSDIVDRSAVEDAIEYLKEYQSVKAVLKYKKRRYEEMAEAVLKQGQEREAFCQAEITRYQEAVKNCEEAENKYLKLAQNLGEVSNDPLTWDELRQMEGKPVWIDSVPLVRRWVIIKKFHPIGGNKNLFDMEVEDGAHFLRKNMRRDDPAWWQAYRKERK